jgi:photosystem II stability/assembly factor-like uncharacterized protein
VLSLAVAFAQARPAVIFAGAATGVEAGASISRDAGQTWVSVDGELVEATVLSLTVSPRYAADQTIYAATSGGLFSSQDGGCRWWRVEPWERVTALVVVPHADAAIVLAAVPGVGIVRTCAGRTDWQTIPVSSPRQP